MPKDLKKTITEKISRTNWEPLAQHMESDSLYLLDEDCELAEVSEALAEDNQSRIKQLINDGLFYPPTQEEVDSFASNLDIEFNVIKITPYIIIQKRFQS
jgi:hypothetical protein